MADPGYIVDGVLTDGEAWTALNTTTLGSDAALVTFKSGFADGDDPAGSGSGGVQNWDQYMDLVVIGYVAIESGGFGAVMQFNDDNSANYVVQALRGDGADDTAYTASTGADGSAVWLSYGTSTTNVFSCGITSILDINSGKYKSAINQTAADWDGSGWVALNAHTWKSQAPITEIDIKDYYLTGKNLLTGSTFSLFGVLPRMVA